MKEKNVAWIVPKNSELYRAIQDEVQPRDSTQPSATIRDMLNEYISTRDIHAMLQELRSGASVEDIRIILQEFRSGPSLEDIRTMLRQELAHMQVVATTSTGQADVAMIDNTMSNADEADAAWPD